MARFIIMFIRVMMVNIMLERILKRLKIQKLKNPSQFPKKRSPSRSRKLNP
jgi:hypothetical protein